MSPGVQTPPYVPILYAFVCSGRYLHVVGGVQGPYMLSPSLTCCTPPPIWGCPHWLPSLCICMFRGYLHVIWGIFTLCWGFGGHSPICWGFGGHHQICQALVPGSTSIGCPLCFILYLFCSSLCLTYLPQLQLLLLRLWWCLLVCHLFHQSPLAPSLMGLPATLGQCEVVLPPPLMLRRPGGVIGLASVPQQQPPSSMPLLTYANYAMGSPKVGFFFRVEPPNVLYIICLVSILVSAFYFQVPSWMLYSPMEAQPLGFAPLQPF